MNGKLILFPVGIGSEELTPVLPPDNLHFLSQCHIFIVEQERTARRFLKKAGYPHPIDTVLLLPLNQHTTAQEYEHYLDEALNGNNIGLLSEAGLPCIADPGAKIVHLAHRKGIDVCPLVGPSSLMLALMASGFNGQSFAFNGYLPVKETELISALRRYEQRMVNDNQTQIFIEAPYRNDRLLSIMARVLSPTTLISVACDLTLPSQTIITLPARKWTPRRSSISFNKRNSVFLIGR